MLKRKAEEEDDEAAAKVLKPDTHYRQKVLEYRLQWHYILRFLPDKDRVWCSWVSWEWHRRSEGVPLDDRYGVTSSYIDVAPAYPSDYFSCRRYRAPTWRDLFFCHSTVVDLELSVPNIELTRRTIGFMPHLKILKLECTVRKIQYLPETLETLELGRSSALNLAVLPRSLRTLRMRKYDGPALPSWIEHLTLEISTKKPYNWLPSSLKSLEITLKEWDLCTKSLLPDDIQTLVLRCRSKKFGHMEDEFYPATIKHATIISSDEMNEFIPPPSSAIVIDKSNVFNAPCRRVKAYHHKFDKDLHLEPGDLNEGLEEIHDLADHLEVTRHKDSGGICGLSELPKSVRVMFHRGKAYDPRTFEPIPEPATRVKGRTVVYKSCGFE